MPDDANLESFREEARAWLADNFPSAIAGRGGELVGMEEASDNADLEKWRVALGEKGWGTPTWPTEYGGGGLSQMQAQVIDQEMRKIGAFNHLPVIAGIGITMFCPTILEYGTEAQKQKQLLLTLDCQSKLNFARGALFPTKDLHLQLNSNQGKKPKNLRFSLTKTAFVLHVYIQMSKITQ